jgi:hypothetical protein
VVAPGDQEFFRVTNAPCRIRPQSARLSVPPMLLALADEVIE